MALINTSQTPLMSTLHSKPSAPSFFEYLGAAVEGTWDRNPLQLWRRQANIYEAQYGSEEISDLVGAAESDGLTFDVSELPQLQVKNELSLEQQKEYLVKHSTRAWLDSASDAGTPSLADSREALRRYRAGEMSEEEMALGVPGLYPEKEGWTYEDQLQDLENKYTEQVLKDYGIKPEERLNAEALDIILQARMNDRKNADIRERAPAWMTPFGLAADFATAMFDPIILGSGIIIPSAAASNFYLRSLQEAGTMTVGNAIKRAGVRFSAGALEGMAATALIEPINTALSKGQQFEYGALDSLTNIAAGGILGGMFRSVGGWWGERVRAKRGQRQEWHVAVPDAESEALREELKANILRHAKEVGADKIGVYEADATASVWDATARTVSYDTKLGVRKFYDDNPIEWRHISKEDTPGDSFDLGFVSNSDSEYDTRWVPGFKSIEAIPYTINYARKVAPSDKEALPPLIKAAYNDNLSLYKGKELSFTDENGNQQTARVSSVGLNELLRKRKMSEDDIAIANNLPSVFSNTHIYRVEKANDKHGIPRPVMHGVAAINLNGEPVLVRTVFKRARDANGEFWQYYGSTIMRGKKQDGVSVSAIHQADALHHPSETPSLGKTLYDWISNVNDKGQRFPDDVSILEQRAGSFDAPLTTKGRVAFLDDGKAVIEFFKSADASTAPHELYHVYRRVMEKYSADANASPRMKDDWIAACEFVGARPGEAWTTEMEEKFARAGERFLMEGVAPHPTLDDTFSRMKEWFTEIYTNADDAGLEISPAMRKVFGDALRLDATDADIAFKYHLGAMVDDSDAAAIRTDFDAPERKAGETDEQYQERLTEFERDTEVQYREALENIKQEDSVEGRQLLAELEQEKAALTSEAEALEMRRQAMLEAAMCDVRKG